MNNKYNECKLKHDRLKNPYYIPIFEQDTIYGFFDYVSRDSRGKLCEDYIYFKKTLYKLINMTPKQLSINYLEYLKTLDFENMTNKEYSSYSLLCNCKVNDFSIFFKVIEKKFYKIKKYLDENNNDKKSKEYIFALDLWLYIWH